MPPRFGGLGFFPSSFTTAFRLNAGGVGQNAPCLLPAGAGGSCVKEEGFGVLKTGNAAARTGWLVRMEVALSGARTLRGAAAGAVPAAPSAVPPPACRESRFSLQTAPRPARSGEAEQPSLPTSSRYRFSVLAQSLPQNRICRDFFFPSTPSIPAARSLTACTLSISGRAPPSSAPFVSFQPSA